ncbi:hypothetical protein HanPI659440_Chr09g0339611 [Helianthus annuus]|nr:hypothetical protein HanPI659440_Chr09g0339611 [Helianthus annuus]
MGVKGVGERMVVVVGQGRRCVEGCGVGEWWVEVQIQNLSLDRFRFLLVSVEDFVLGLWSLVTFEEMASINGGFCWWGFQGFLLGIGGEFECFEQSF